MIGAVYEEKGEFDLSHSAFVGRSYRFLSLPMGLHSFSLGIYGSGNRCFHFANSLLERNSSDRNIDDHQTKNRNEKTFDRHVLYMGIADFGVADRVLADRCRRYCFSGIII